MKKALFFAGLAAAALSFVGCNKEADYAGNGTPIEIVLNTVDTRTVNDGLETKWKANDALSVFYAPAGTTEWSANTKFTVTDTEAGLAKGEVSLTAESNDWYLFYPYKSQIPNPKTTLEDNTRDGYVYVGSGANSSQKQTGLNSMAHLAGGDLPMVGIQKGVAASEQPNVTMKHLTTVARVNVTNATAAPITITAVSFTAPENVVGTYFIDFSGDEPDFTESGDSYVSKTARLEVKDAEPLAAGATASFYIAMKPFTAPVGSTLKVQVYAGAEVSESELALTNAVSFQANHIKKLNVEYAPEAVEGKTLAEALALTDNTDVTLVPLTVGAVSTKGYVVTDGTDGLYVYVNSTPSVKVGDVVKVTGKMASYYGVRQVANPSQTVVTEGDGTFEADWTDITGNFESYTNSSSAPVKYEATVVKSGTHTNFKVEGADTFVGTLTNAPSAMFEGINEGDKVRVYGYFSTINTTNNLVGVYAYKLEVISAGVSFKAELPGADESLSLTVPATTTSKTINVTGNVAWTAVASDGATVEPASGEGAGTVTVSFPANTDPAPKEYTVAVSTDNPAIIAAGGDEDEYVFTITQEAAEDTGVTTVSTTMEAYAKAHECTISEGSTVVNYKTLQLDDVVTMSTTGEGNCGSFWYATGTQWRLYQNKSGNLVVSLASGYKLKSVSFVYEVTNTGTLKDSQGNVVASGDVYETDASSVEFTVGNTGSATNGQVRITEVTIKYQKGEGTTPTPVDPTIEVSSTLSVVKGETATIAVTTNSNGAKTWSSSDETVATVDNSGVVTGVKAGTATVTLSIAATTSYNAGSAQVAVTVTEPVTDANTVSMTMTQYVEANNCTVSSGSDVTMYKTLQLNPSVRMSTTGEDNCGSFWNTSNSNTTKQWRLYQNKNGNVIVSVAQGCELKSVKLTYGTSNNGTLLDGAGNAVASDAVQVVSGSSVTYTVGNTEQGGANGQVRITAVEVKYTGNGTTFPDNPDPQPTEIETKITMPNNANVYVGETVALNATSNVEGATITYESEDAAIATVNASGVVTGVADGSVKVWARIAGVADSYTSAERFCTVTVTTKPEETEGTVVFDVNYLKDHKDGEKGVISYTNSSDYGTAVPTELRVYKSKEFVVSASGDYKITSIKMTCTKNGTTKEGPGCWGAGAPEGYTFQTDGPVGTWSGSASSVSFTATDNQVRIIELVVTYE